MSTWVARPTRRTPTPKTEVMCLDSRFAGVKRPALTFRRRCVAYSGSIVRGITQSSKGVQEATETLPTGCGIRARPRRHERRKTLRNRVDRTAPTIPQDRVGRACPPRTPQIRRTWPVRTGRRLSGDPPRRRHRSSGGDQRFSSIPPPDRYSLQAPAVENQTRRELLRSARRGVSHSRGEKKGIH